MHVAYSDVIPQTGVLATLCATVMRLHLPLSALKPDHTAQSKEPAEVARSRSGLFGFFRPQKTVSPLTHPTPHDIFSVANCCASSPGRGPANDRQEPSHAPDPGSAWSTLPEHLIESIMQMLQTESPPPMHHSVKTIRQVIEIPVLSYNV